MSSQSSPGGYLVKDFAYGWYWTPNASLDHARGATIWSVAHNRYETDPLSAAPAPEGGAVAMIRALLDHIDRETCHHDNLKRGGVQWTICEDCDRKWADDQGGFKPHVDAPPVAAARLYLAALATRSDGKPEGGAVKGPGDYTMALTEPQPFERFPALASHIERMAVGRSVGSLIEWDAFLRELNAALATREEAPAEAGEPMTDAEVRQWIEACNHEPARQVLREYLVLRAQPPAPAPDALRVAVEALEKIATVDMGGGFLGALACRQVATKALTDMQVNQKGGV